MFGFPWLGNPSYKATLVKGIHTASAGGTPRTEALLMQGRHSAARGGDTTRDAVAAAALTVVRRAMVEGVPVTRELFEHEAAVTLDTPSIVAMAEVDAEAQRLGVSSLG